MTRIDAFSKYHPAVNLVFFVGAISLGAFLQHPIYLLTGLLASGIYYLILNGRNGIKMLLAMIPLFTFIVLFNPIVNTRGNNILFYIGERTYTLEAFIYGAVIATIFVMMVMWFGCYNKVLTGDKFTCLFSNIMPALSLVFVMVLRMIPNLIRKAKQIIGVRASLGKELQDFQSGITVLSVLTSWALEESVVTADSMKARGYGTSKRTSFAVYRMTKSDWLLSAWMCIFWGIMVLFAAKGSTYAKFFPKMEWTSVSGVNSIGFIAYVGYIFIPVLLNCKEEIHWNILRLRI